MSGTFVYSVISCAVFLLDVSRAAAAPGRRLTYPRAPALRLPPLAGLWSGPLLSSCLFFLSVAQSTRWAASRALARLSGRPGRSLGGPARHPSAAGLRRPWRRRVGGRVRCGDAARGGATGLRSGARSERRRGTEGEAGRRERCWGCLLWVGREGMLDLGWVLAPPVWGKQLFKDG